MFHLYKVVLNLKNSEPNYLVFKNKPKNTTLLEHSTKIGFEIKDKNFQLDMLDNLDEKTILFSPKMITHSIQLFTGTQEEIEKIIGTYLKG